MIIPTSSIKSKVKAKKTVIYLVYLKDLRQVLVLRLEHFSIFPADLLPICGAIWACLTPMAQVTTPPPIQFLAFLAECPQTASKTGKCFNLYDDFLFYFYLAFISLNQN